jgi:hypothetical protein
MKQRTKMCGVALISVGALYGYSHNPEFAASVDALPAATQVLGSLGLHGAVDQANYAQPDNPVDVAPNATSTPSPSTSASGTIQLRNNECPPTWVKITPSDNTEAGNSVEYNGLTPMRHFSDKPTAFPHDICVAAPVPKTKGSKDWSIAGNVITAHVRVLDPSTSPCGDELDKCLASSPSSIEILDDTASGGRHGWYDGSHPDMPSPDGIDMSSMRVKLILDLANGTTRVLK